MIYQMYSVFDLKVGIYHPPIYFRSAGEAIRSFVGAATEGTSLLSKYPKDFSLYHLGTWCDVSGKHDCLPDAGFIGVLHDLIDHESLEKVARSAQDVETAKKDA